MNKKFISFVKGFIAFIVGASLMYLKTTDSTAGEMINDFTKYFSNSNFIANAGIIFTGIVTVVLGYLKTKSDDENTNIKLDIQTVTPEMQQQSIKTDMILHNQEILKNVLTKEYTDLKLPIDTKNSILSDLSQMKFLGGKVEEVKQDVKEFIPYVAEEINQKAESIIEKLRNKA